MIRKSSLLGPASKEERMNSLVALCSEIAVNLVLSGGSVCLEETVVKNGAFAGELLFAQLS